MEFIKDLTEKEISEVIGVSKAKKIYDFYNTSMNWLLFS